MDTNAKPKARHLILGETGERIAKEYLIKIGYKIFDHNVRLTHDEIDIIAHDPTDNVIVFVEVKTRAHFYSDFVPSISAGYRKWRPLRRAIRRWVANHNYDGGYRIDLISVADFQVIEHLKQVGL